MMIWCSDVTLSENKIAGNFIFGILVLNSEIRNVQQPCLKAMSGHLSEYLKWKSTKWTKSSGFNAKFFKEEQIVWECIDKFGWFILYIKPVSPERFEKCGLKKRFEKCDLTAKFKSSLLWLILISVSFTN